MPQRRDALKLALGSSALLPAMLLARDAAWSDPVEASPSAPSAPASAEPVTPPEAVKPPEPVKPAEPVKPPIANASLPLGPPVAFTPSTVVELARELAKQPFKPVGSELPEPFRSLTGEQYAAIRPKPEARIWADEQLGFVVEPMHRGFQITTPIQLNLVADGQAQRLIYETRLFDFGKLNPSGKIREIGFAGFRVQRTRAGEPAGDHPPTDLATFQGTNFWQALAGGQVPGLMARALAIKVADPKGEEMPTFRQLWIEKPSPVADLLVVHGLIDSDSLSGAFLFPRAAVDNYGLASMSATHLLGFIDHRRFDDYRPNVAEVNGVQMLTGAGEWLWRPVSNPDELQISTFVDAKPRGFGCLVRDRDFGNYLDEEQRWERRPSLWVEPLGDWGEGGIQLIEIPSQSEANDNILCFWRPKAPLKAGQEASFAYRQFWCWDPPERPDLARAARSHSGLSAPGSKRFRFFVEFEGDVLGDEKRTAGIRAALTSSTGSITMLRTFALPDRKATRVLFEFDPQSASSSELRLILQAGEDRLSETWLYRWTAS